VTLLRTNGCSEKRHIDGLRRDIIAVVTDQQDYREVNRANWDDRAPLHAASAEYGLDRFERDPEFLSDVVRFDVPRLGDIRGLRGIHLQCHIGTDTVSLSRLGATMTGLDFSPASLAVARSLAERAGADVTFIEGDVYDAADLAGEGEYDLVFTGIGAIGWLPDIARWGRTVAALLRPGGQFFMREGHPVLWACADPRPDGVLALDFPYFEHAEPTVWNSDATYVQTDTTIIHTTTHEWNHGMGEIVTALLDAGMTITALVEHDTVPWDALPGMMEQLDLGEWRLRDRPERLPHTYTLQAVKQ
jgi:SAM-dependent methyltransferase